MQNLNLPLVSRLDSTQNVNTLVKEAKSPQLYPTNILEPLENALKGLFPQNTEENTVIKMRRILGEKANDLSDDQIHCAATEFQFLINIWLDEFEKDIFNGMTLKEVLNEK